MKITPREHITIKSTIFITWVHACENVESSPTHTKGYESFTTVRTSYRTQWETWLATTNFTKPPKALFKCIEQQHIYPIRSKKNIVNTSKDTWQTFAPISCHLAPPSLFSPLSAWTTQSTSKKLHSCSLLERSKLSDISCPDINSGKKKAHPPTQLMRKHIHLPNTCANILKSITSPPCRSAELTVLAWYVPQGLRPTPTSQ